MAAAAVDKLTQQLCRHRRPALSAAAVSWLEILLVDVALRNRDRFSVVWPLLRDHYKRTLFGAGDGGGVSIKLSYITERYVSIRIFEVLKKIFIVDDHGEQSTPGE